MRATDLHVTDPKPITYSLDTCPEREVLLRRHAPPTRRLSADGRSGRVDNTLSEDVLRAEDALQLAMELVRQAKDVLRREGRLHASEAQTALAELHNMTMERSRG